MTVSRFLPLAAATLVAMSPAFAQLKAPKTPPSPTPAVAAAQPAPAASPAPAPAANNPNADKEAAGRLAAAGWLVLLDRRDWGGAWEASSQTFRKSVPLDAWMDAIPKVRAPMGQFVEREAVDSNFKAYLPGQPAGEYVSVVFQSKFSDKVVAEVVTTVHDADGRWRVTGYSPR